MRVWANYQPWTVRSNGWMGRKTNDTRRMKSGEALQVHADSAHKGEIDLSCRACTEIQAKMTAMGATASVTEI